ncbi:hypothetical protein DIE23_20525 [Burkholderia sp. Bp9143]|nr:hypothetical protein DIE23_20525 [Burkholderia sp. Bp9143]
MLLVGGYVTFDRTCKANPVCRGESTPGPVAAEASLQPADAPTLPVVPAPVYAFHPADATQAGAKHADAKQADITQDDVDLPRAAADTSPPATRRATAMVARQAPPLHEPPQARGGMRVADWKGGAAARRTHAIRRVSQHMRHGHRAVATDARLAMVYRGH